MFGRRNRKPQEEEDPLVPHGLIWQATDEPRQPTESDPQLKSSAEVAQTPSPHEKPPATSVGPPSRVSSTQPPPLTVADASRAKLGAISPPIPWPSPKTASVIRRLPPPTTSPVLPSVTVPSLTEPQKHPPPLLHDAPKTPPRDEVKVVNLGTTAQAAESSRRPGTISQVLESLGQRVGSIRAAISGFWGQLRDTGRDASAAINFRSCLEGLKRAQEKCVGTLSSWSRLAGRSFEHWWRSNRSRMARMKSAFGRFCSETSRSSVARWANLGQRIRNHKLRIRIVKPAGAHQLIKRSKLVWAAREHAIRREPRLWTSMTMAALSAILTLGVISAVSHYAPGADASNKAVANPPKHNSGAINPKIVVGPRTSGTTTQASRSTRSFASRPAQPAWARQNSRPKTATRRADRNPDEGYVAPDTYRYYGMNGKSR